MSLIRYSFGVKGFYAVSTSKKYLQYSYYKN